MMKKTIALALIAFLAITPILSSAEHKNKLLRLSGEITAINSVDLQIAVADVVVQVTADTVIMKQQVPITFDDLEVGMNVNVRGFMDGDLFVACKINVKCDDAGARIEGVIGSIDSGNLQIVVDGTTVQVTSTTLIQMKNSVFDFEDLEVGMTVAACGTYDGDILVANKITVKYGGQ